MHWITIFRSVVVIGQWTEILVWLVQVIFGGTFSFMHMSVTSRILSINPWNCQVQISSSNAKFSNQARLGQIKFKPIKYLETIRSGDLQGSQCWLGWNPQFGFESCLVNISFCYSCYFCTMMCVCNIFTIYHGQGNWLVSSICFSGSF